MQHYRHPTWAQGEIAHLLVELEPEGVENKAKFQPNQLTQRETIMGQVQMIIEVHPPKMGLIQPNHGATAPH